MSTVILIHRQKLCDSFLGDIQLALFRLATRCRTAFRFTSFPAWCASMSSEMMSAQVLMSTDMVCGFFYFFRFSIAAARNWQRRKGCHRIYADFTGFSQSVLSSRDGTSKKKEKKHNTFQDGPQQATATTYQHNNNEPTATQSPTRQPDQCNTHTMDPTHPAGDQPPLAATTLTSTPSQLLQLVHLNRRSTRNTPNSKNQSPKVQTSLTHTARCRSPPSVLGRLQL